MQTNALILGILDVAVLLFLVYAVYTINKKRAEKAAAPAPKPVTAEQPKAEPPKPAPEPRVEEPKAQPIVAEPPPPPAPQAEAAPVAEQKTEPAKAKPTRPANGKREHGLDIIDIEGIGKKHAEKFHDLGIYHTSELLEAGATPKGRAELAAKTGISHNLILEWVNLADLFRVKGIGEEYSDLLEEAGVDTVVELSHRNAEHLHAKILEVNDAKRLVRRPPSQAVIEGWISEAKTLPRVVEY